jgi:V/A-type H+-transporting ATPase subunit E
MSEVRNDKLNGLRELLLLQAEQEKMGILEKAKKEAESLAAQEADRIAREEELILKDAEDRAEATRRRQVMAAEREKAAEGLRLQSRLLSEAVSMLEDRFGRLREREDYARILAGLVAEAESVLPGSEGLRVRLAGSDAAIGNDVAKTAMVLLPGLDVAFDPDPAPILGGAWVSTADGRRFVAADWRNRARETAGELAERLLPML